MKKIIFIILLLSISVSCIFAFTACSETEQLKLILKITQSEHTDKVTYVLEFTATDAIAVYRKIDTIADNYVESNISDLSTSYYYNDKNNDFGNILPYIFFKGDKIRISINTYPTTQIECVSISFAYLNTGEVKTLQYNF